MQFFLGALSVSDIFRVEKPNELNSLAVNGVFCCLLITFANSLTLQ